MFLGLPFAAWGSIFGALTGWWTKTHAMKLELQAAERKHQSEMLARVATANTSAVKNEVELLNAKASFEERMARSDPHRSVARRVIAYMVLISVLFLVPGFVVFGDSFEWFQIVSHTESSRGFLGIFGAYSKEVYEVVSAVGLPLVWLDGALIALSTTVSFYMGGSAAKFSNPYASR